MSNVNLTVENIINSVFDGLERNNFSVLEDPDNPMYEPPLIGVAAGDDSYFEFLKKHIGDFHWSPSEAFGKKYSDVPEASKLRVISLIFPQTETTKALQSKQHVFPCDNWIVSRGEWEGMMREFGDKIEQALETKGIRGVSIDLIEEFSRQESNDLGIASTWSHRHAAFAAGMGTFGLSDGFISRKGMAVRMTSIIVEADLEVNNRGDIGPYDWCLYYRSGICGACIRRCPIRAISEKGHDKNACLEYEDVAIEKYWPENIERGNYIFGCGLCQTKVPCMDKKP